MDLENGIKLAPTAKLSVRAVIIIVGYRNPSDIVECLTSLANSEPEPSFEVFVAENGGPDAMDALAQALTGAGVCVSTESVCDISLASAPIRQCSTFLLVDKHSNPRSRVHIAEMSENLGYAGGVNGWLRALLNVPGWYGAWVLNPDATAMPTALAELVAYSAANGKGMVGSRLIDEEHAVRQQTRGLVWRKFLASTLAVDSNSPVSPAPEPVDVERRIDAPSGASCYVTRDLIERIGLMDERYFLYFEDLEWGLRAKSLGSVGYAHRSIVIHGGGGGTTIGTSRDQTTMSPLAVYLEFRNRILFVKSCYPAWFVWTVFMQFCYASKLGLIGAFRNMLAAYQGLFAAMAGENGRPDRNWRSLYPGRALPPAASLAERSLCKTK